MKFNRLIFIILFLNLIFLTIIFIKLNDNSISTTNKINQNIFDSKKSKINEILNLIENEYVDKLDKNELENKAISFLLEELDPHTVYIPADDFLQANEELQGNFGGIGIQFFKYKDTVVVIKPIEGGPSKNAGIVAGDRIVTVDDSVIAGKKMLTSDIIGLLKGKVGTMVKLGIKSRNKTSLWYANFQRDWIPVKSVQIAYMLDRKTGYVYISAFGRNTYNEFMQAIERLKKEGMQQIIVDLRGNNGGYMQAAVAITNEFFPKGTLLVYTKGHSRSRINNSSNGRGKLQDIPIAVIIDDQSASASEIFSGAIQDNDRGIVVGRRSFGKGLVQEQYEFKDGSALRLTVSHYYTPTGRSIQKPYDRKNKKEYYLDIFNRFDQGEFQKIDTSLFVDSLKRVTKGGKIVYGGGGIMPDVFVPLDTTEFTNYYSYLNQNGILRNFAFHYVDKYRPQIQEFDNIEDIEKFLSKNDYINDFFEYLKINDLKTNQKEYKTSENLITNQIKTIIAGDIMDNEGSYRIRHQIDEVLVKTVEALNSIE